MSLAHFITSDVANDSPSSSTFDPTSHVVVTVIEAGPLEKQVCLLVESLRRWGGRLATVPVVAVKPRRGPRLSSSTLRKLDRLNVKYTQIDRDDGYAWFPYLNKTAAVKHVAAYHRGTIIWIDADVLILGEPSELILDARDPKGLKFAACASDRNIGTSQDDDRFAPYFKVACATLGVDFASLPYLLTEEERIPIRAYWNSGIYAFASDSGLAELHHSFTLSLVQNGVASHESKLYFSDQISLGLAAHRLGLNYRNLSWSHNYPLQPYTINPRLTVPETEIRILHYHGCMWQPAFEELCAALELHFPDVAHWLRSQGPVANTTYLPRLYRKLLEINRKRIYAKALKKAKYY